jgi:hypothetical protein
VRARAVTTCVGGCKGAVKGFDSDRYKLLIYEFRAATRGLFIGGRPGRVEEAEGGVESA